MSEDNPVTLDVTDSGVAVLRLARPDRHNALNPELMQALIDHLEEIKATPTIRAVLLEGEGKSFSAGMDVEWLHYAEVYTHADHIADGRLVSEMLHKLHDLEPPTIALVNGAAIGGGLGLIAACDMAIAVKWAEFRFSEVRLGLSPSLVAPYVVQAIGPRWARMLFATGKAFNAQLAREMGLVHEIAEDIDALHQQADDLVDIIFHAAPQAISESKKVVSEVARRDIDSGMRSKMVERFARERTGDEAKEGIAAFLEKRKPSWAV